MTTLLDTHEEIELCKLQRQLNVFVGMSTCKLILGRIYIKDIFVFYRYEIFLGTLQSKSDYLSDQRFDSSVKIFNFIEIFRFISVSMQSQFV